MRKVSFAFGEYYHIYNRGNSKQKIFNNKEDYLHFIGLMYVCNQKENFKADNLSKGQDLFEAERKGELVNIGAYCLMPNHFHILITEAEDGDISKFIQKLSTAYVMYFNKKYERSGGLFEGKFKSQHIAEDRYLKYIFSYIHLNPIKLIDGKWKKEGIKDKKNATEFLRHYFFSSFSDFIGINRVQKQVLNLKLFPKYFPTKESFEKEIFEWLNYNESFD